MEREINNLYELVDALQDFDTEDVPYIGPVVTAYGDEMALKIGHSEDGGCIGYFILPTGD